MTARAFPRVGLVGLGDLGGPMVHRLLDRGVPVHVWARRVAATEPFAARGAKVAASLDSMAEACDVVGVCVSDDAATQEVARVVLDHLPAGGVLAVHATVSPETCCDLKDGLRPEVDVVDAPVSGGPAAASTGRLAILVGGERAAVDQCRPVFDHWARFVRHLGPLGSGQKAKLINNALFSAHAALAVEALEIAEAAGLAREVFAEVLAASSGHSRAQRSLVRLGDPDHRVRIASLMAKDQRLFDELATACGGGVSALGAGHTFIEELKRLLAGGMGTPPWAVAIDDG